MKLIWIPILIFVSGCASGLKKSHKDFNYKAVEASEMRGECKLSSESKLKKSVEMAGICLARKKYEKVHEIALHIRSLDEKSPWGYYFDSLYFSKKGYKSPALWYAKKALERNKRNALMHYQVGRAYYELDDKTYALSHFEKANQLDDSLEENRLFLAKTYLSNKMYKKANIEFSKIKSRKYDFDKNLGLYLSSMQLQDYQRALSHIREISSRKYDNQNYVHLAFLYSKVGEIEKALDTYKYVLKQNKWQNTTHTKQQISDKIRELKVQKRAIANAKQNKEKKK